MVALPLKTSDMACCSGFSFFVNIKWAVQTPLKNSKPPETVMHDTVNMKVPKHHGAKQYT